MTEAAIDAAGSLMTEPTIGSRYRAARKAKGLSQGALAKLANVSQQTISDLESDKTDPVVLSARDLASALDSDLAALVLGAPAGDAATANGRVTLDEIAPSPLNARRTFRPETIDEMAASIASQGILQPLLLRPAPAPTKGKAKGKTRFHIVAGERRWRGALKAREDGTWPEHLHPGQAIPHVVREIDDETHLKLILIENLQREDLPVLEEAECFAALHEIDPEKHSTKAIAQSIGKTTRFVQQRIALARKLIKPAQKLLAAGKINVDAARFLCQVDAKLQDTAVVEIEKGFIRDIGALRRALIGDLPVVDAAIFDPALYTGSFVENEDEPEDRRFADVAQFRKLQGAAVEAKRVELEKEWAWAEIVSFSYYQAYDYGRSKDKKKAGALVNYKPNGGVDILEGLVRPEDVKRESNTGNAKPAKPAEDFLKSNLAYAGNRKTEALQRAIARDPRTPKIMVCLGLLTATENVHIDAGDHGPDDRILDPSVTETLQDCARGLKGVKFGTLDPEARRWPLRIEGVDDYCMHPSPERERDAYIALKALPDDELDQLFSTLVAARCGAFNGFAPSLGDSPLAVQLAEDLGIDMTYRWRLDEAYARKLRKPRLLELLDALGVDGAGGDTPELDRQPKGQLVKMLISSATFHHILPREMQFGSETDLKNAKPIVVPAEAPAEG